MGVNFIAVSGIAIGLFTVLLIFKNGRPGKAEIILALWILALVLNQLYFLAVGPEMEWLSDSPVILHLTGTGLALIHAPLLYLFCSRLFYPKINPGMVWHFLPFLAFFFVMGTTHVLHDDIMEFRHGFIGFKEVVFPLNYYGIYLALVSGIYTLAAFLSIKKQKSLLSQTQSGEIRNVLNWLEYWVMAALVFFILTYLVIEISVSSQQIDSRLTFQIINVFLSVYIIYVGYWAIRKTSAFQNLNAAVLSELKLKNNSTSVPDTEVESISQSIVEILEKDELYLNPDFSLTDLSSAVHVPLGKLSFAINTGLGMNFYDLINSYRVKEFQKRLEQGNATNLTLLGLALDCGFRSKSTFNTFFKKETGMTPSAYKKFLEKKSAKI